MTRLIAMLGMMLLCGCASAVDKTMQSWMGAHESKLIASWGPPQSSASDGAGGRVLVYSSRVDFGQTPGIVYPSHLGLHYYTAPRQHGYERTRMFYVNPEGVIYSWRWQGL